MVNAPNDEPADRLLQRAPLTFEPDRPLRVIRPELHLLVAAVVRLILTGLAVHS
jgi:hypothetical protein